MMTLLVLIVLFAGSRTAAGSLAAGVVLTLCVLTRPTFLLLALLIPAYFWINMVGRARSVSVVLFLLPIVAVFPFLATRGTAMTGSFPPPLMDPGVSFFMGNNPLAGSTTPEYPPLVIDLAKEFPDEVDYDHAIYRLVARRGSTIPLDQGETNRFWASRAMNFIRDEPVHFIGQLGRKAFFLFHGHRWHDLADGYVADRHLADRSVPFVPMAVISALAVAGLAAGLRRWRVYSIYYIGFFAQATAMLVTYTAVERLRLALLPFFVVFAVVGLDWLLRNGRSRFIGVPVLLLLFLFSYDSDLMRDNNRNWENYTRQSRLQEETYRLRDALEFPKATETLVRCYATAPWMAPLGIPPAGLPMPTEGLAKAALREFPSVRGDDPTSRLDRAVLMIESGDLEAAEGSLTRLRREGHAFNRIINRPAQPAYFLGRIAALRGRTAEAINFMNEALAEAPGDPTILAQLAAMTGEERYATRISRYFGELNALYFLASAQLENGQPEPAVLRFRQLIDRLPEYWKGKILLAAALADAGRDEEAIGTYLDAMQRRSEPLVFPEKILPAFRRQAERSADGDGAWFRYAVALRQSGNYLEARRVLRKSMGAARSPVFRQELATLDETMLRAGLR
jgi:tetratricopeptide (TPR) repeat protein